MLKRFFICAAVCAFIGFASARWLGRDKGPYCAVRPVEKCCPGRNDQCTMPIHDTLCYCDIFCNETAHDCCPDFIDTCFGGGSIRIPEDDDGFGEDDSSDKINNNCYEFGKLHKLGDEYSKNCNNCTCTNLGFELNWRCTTKTCLIRPEVIDYINNNRRGWSARNYTQFWGLSLEEGHRYRLGTRKPTSDVVQMTSVHQTDFDRIPAQFDSRVEWAGLISDVIDQGNCASSWAVSTAGVATDRLHAHSNGVHMDVLSPQHFVSCNNDQGQHGCGSGHLDRAWWFMRKIGLVSTNCFEYTSGKTGKASNCPLPRTYAALKNARCPTSGKPAAVFQASPPYRIAPLEEDIKLEIMTNGPVQAVMEVSDDFFSYQSGVYKRSMPAYFAPQGETSQDKHYHSVRLIGWGTEYTSEGREAKYWIAANSWGPWWGENGYFRIERGSNESGIESFVLGVWIKVNDRQLIQKRGQGRLHNHRQPPFMRQHKRHARRAMMGGV